MSRTLNLRLLCCIWLQLLSHVDLCLARSFQPLSSSQMPLTSQPYISSGCSHKRTPQPPPILATPIFSIQRDNQNLKHKEIRFCKNKSSQSLYGIAMKACNMWIHFSLTERLTWLVVANHSKIVSIYSIIDRECINGILYSIKINDVTTC